MTTMISEVYRAFIAAGMPEEEARKAAEALPAESLATKGDITRVEKELLVIKWMLALVIATTTLPLLKSLLS